jgi:membrane associated rhomboid family serine protease
MERKYNGIGFSFVIIGVITFVVFLLQLAIPGFTEAFLLNEEVFHGELYRFVTSIFLHGGMSHLLSNLFALLLFGVILESIIGARRFLVVYFSAGIIANIISVFFYPSSLGASGAIYGVIGCVTILRPKMMIWAFGLVVPMYVASVMWVILDFLGIFVPDGVGNIAHLSGIFVGFLIGVFFIRNHLFVQRKKRSKVVLNEAYMDAWERRFMR